MKEIFDYFLNFFFLGGGKEEEKEGASPRVQCRGAAGRWRAPPRRAAMAAADLGRLWA